MSPGQGGNLVEIKIMEMKNAAQAGGQADTATWKRVVAEYQKPSTPRALWQVVNTLVPYGLLWLIMYHTVQVSWWLTIPLAILAAGFLVRVFIIFHDCGHGSFFKSRTANSGIVNHQETCTVWYMINHSKP